MIAFLMNDPRFGVMILAGILVVAILVLFFRGVPKLVDKINHDIEASKN